MLGYGSDVAVTSSTFTIPAGTVAAIIGPNGSGKSTMLNAIAGLVEPQSGTLDVPARNAPGHRIAYVLQTTKVNDALPITVGEVVAMARYSGLGFYQSLGQDDREAVAVAMERVGITAMANKHLHELSGGQRQRVFVAQGLAQEHDILMLDEPLTGIDLPTAQAIDAVIHDERSRGCTVIMTTHDLSEAQVADHVVMMSGRVVASGKPDEVLTTENLVTAYGPSLLHIGDGTIFIDDPAHVPVVGRQVHQQRVIHTDPLPSDVHHDDV
ncbi:MAG: metal ABC transporter ATP-binding protein [Acidimicrobiia bacterium]|nr:metal ABC transporter ATP-binding protein [Acidimicrobiia bacterium]